MVREENRQHHRRINKILTKLLTERVEKEDGDCSNFRWVDDDTPFIGEEKFNLLHRLHKDEESLGEVRSLFLEAEASRDWFED
ncbi:hypothetical protein K7X08_014966 [Anisodus acutangulus]|uniref:Uncharacterized protein n=1 Tax=Anisodus acutangulus TaxID=402998 RepID=A0A9Q1L4Y9_9SOLA|nr:hypothetical protein K7X08_014966 [Anisodus acutangulus]